jgi:hypothetical protein
VAYRNSFVRRLGSAVGTPGPPLTAAGPRCWARRSGWAMRLRPWALNVRAYEWALRLLWARRLIIPVRLGQGACGVIGPVRWWVWGTHDAAAAPWLCSLIASYYFLGKIRSRLGQPFRFLWMGADLMHTSASDFSKYLKNVYLRFKKSSHLFRKCIHMSWILVQSFVRNCIIFSAARKKIWLCIWVDIYQKFFFLI